METNLEACEQCGPGLLISADTGSHYPGLGVKPKTAHAKPREGSQRSSDTATRLKRGERGLSETHYSSHAGTRNPAMCAFAKIRPTFPLVVPQLRLTEVTGESDSARTRGVRLQAVADASRLRFESAAKPLDRVALRRNGHIGTFLKDEKWPAVGAESSPSALPRPMNTAKKKGISFLGTFPNVARASQTDMLKRSD